VLLEGLPEGETRAEKEQIAKNCAGVAFVGKTALPRLSKLIC
jgi:hypothetical protein